MLEVQLLLVLLEVRLPLLVLLAGLLPTVLAVLLLAGLQVCPASFASHKRRSKLKIKKRKVEIQTVPT